MCTHNPYRANVHALVVLLPVVQNLCVFQEQADLLWYTDYHYSGLKADSEQSQSFGWGFSSELCLVVLVVSYYMTYVQH